MELEHQSFDIFHEFAHHLRVSGTVFESQRLAELVTDVSLQKLFQQNTATIADADDLSDTSYWTNWSTIRKFGVRKVMEVTYFYHVPRGLLLIRDSEQVW